MESYRYERHIFGSIYLQVFPSGKLYAGQTVNYSKRMSKYKRNNGSNPHHTSALKLYGFDKVHTIRCFCPIYLMDTIETFLIEFYDLTNRNNGYNKTSGGRKHWKHSSETCAKISKARESQVFTPEMREHKRLLFLGDKNPNFGKDMYGEKNPMFGKKNPGASKRMSGPNNPMLGKIGLLNKVSVPVFAFGNVYESARIASDKLRYIFKLKKSYISSWIQRNTRTDDVFKIGREFYQYVQQHDITYVTKELYTIWLSFSVSCG
jgi:Zn-finger protein